jgi:hypothetical protein
MPALVVRAARTAQWRTTCALTCWLLLVSGCASNRWAEQRSDPINPLTQQLDLDSKRGPRPTQRTLQTLRRFALESQLEGDPAAIVMEMQSIATREPTADNVYSLSELAYIGGRRANDDGDAGTALDLYCTAVVNAYFYLFDHTFSADRNAFDPRFRRACDLYNNALENAMKLAIQTGKLPPGGTLVVETAKQVFEFRCADHDHCHKQHFDNLKFVSDYQVNELSNQFRTFGLGVPMIALYEPDCQNSAIDRYYPPGASFPVTAFLRVMSTEPRSPTNPKTRYRCTVELYDPSVTSEIDIGGTPIPLESDLTTPLAYSLDNPAFRRANVPIKGLLDPEESQAVSGLYMLEPYNPNKIPVLMVHGFWSSLITWMEMFNDLRGSEEIRDNYQFWFYLYPTGQPFWLTAATLRSELAEMRGALDPNVVYPAMDEMVLVGHSMGGLIAKMQTVESGNKFWNLVSPYPIEQMVGTPELKSAAYAATYFHPNPSVRRVITIATPHHGSNFSNLTTQWLGRKLINLPDELVRDKNRVLRDNPGFFPEESLIRVPTSVDALATESPLLAAIRNAQRAPWVKYHNIIGLVEESPVLKSMTTNTDGIVSYASAHATEALTEITVKAPHTKVHQHPRAILEVRKLLLQHLVESRANRQPNQSTIKPQVQLTSAESEMR